MKQILALVVVISLLLFTPSLRAEQPNKPEISYYSTVIIVSDTFTDYFGDITGHQMHNEFTNDIIISMFFYANNTHESFINLVLAYEKYVFIYKDVPIAKAIEAISTAIQRLTIGEMGGDLKYIKFLEFPEISDLVTIAHPK